MLVGVRAKRVKSLKNFSPEFYSAPEFLIKNTLFMTFQNELNEEGFLKEKIKKIIEFRKRELEVVGLLDQVVYVSDLFNCQEIIDKVKGVLENGDKSRSVHILKQEYARNHK